MSDGARANLWCGLAAVALVFGFVVGWVMGVQAAEQEYVDRQG